MKKFLLNLFIGAFSNEPIKNRYRYLLINTEAVATNSSFNGAFSANEFVTLEEVRKYIDEYIAKADKENWKLYKLYEDKVV